MSFASNRRRQFFIKKEFQGKFILLYALSIILLAACAAFLFFTRSQEVLESHFFRSHIQVSRTGDILSDVLIHTNLYVFIAIILIVLVVSFLVFNRLNIHFRRMEENLYAMACGDFTRASQPPSYFNEISRLIAMIEEVQDDYRRRYLNLAEILDEVERHGRNGIDRPALLEAKASLDRLLTQIVLPS